MRPGTRVRAIATSQKRAERVLNVLSSNSVTGCAYSRYLHALKSCEQLGGVEHCLDLFLAARSAGFCILNLQCPKCSLPHLSEGD